MTHLKSNFRVGLGSFLALAGLVVAVCPIVERQSELHRLSVRVGQLPDAASSGALARIAEHESRQYTSRPAELDSALASWETVGGCGAGGAGGASSIKWIGHSTSGGLFDVRTMGSYVYLPKSQGSYSSGYNLSLATTISRNITEQWGISASVPLLYKYYSDFLQLPTDVSNSGVGDVDIMGSFRFGPINATMLSLSVGLPTGAHKADYKGTYLTQEKQLGLGKFTGTLTLEHTLDQTWGVVVLGGSAGWRGGENELHNYRSPVASIYAHAGYFAGPFVPAVGLTATRFLKRDRDRTLEQSVPLATLAPSLSLEWANDYVALLAGGQLPLSLFAFDPQPWVVGLGLSFSPF
jgi:hypothetical protein